MEDIEVESKNIAGRVVFVNKPGITSHGSAHDKHVSLYPGRDTVPEHGSQVTADIVKWEYTVCDMLYHASQLPLRHRRRRPPARPPSLRTRSCTARVHAYGGARPLRRPSTPEAFVCAGPLRPSARKIGEADGPATVVAGE